MINRRTIALAEPPDLGGKHFPSRRRLQLGLLLVLSLPLCGAIGFVRGIEVAGFNYTGWLWLTHLFLGPALLLGELNANRSQKIAMPYRPWLVWCAFVWLSLAWTGGAGQRNFQDAIQLTLPILIGMIASVFVRNERQLELLFKVFRFSLIPAAISVVIAMSADWEGMDLRDGLGGMNLTVSLVGCVFLSQFSKRPALALLGWGVCLLLTFYVGARAATAILLLLPVLNPKLKSTRIRLAMGLVIVGLAVTIFYTPWFQYRFFYSGSGSLGDLWGADLSGSGRFEVWPDFLEEAWRHPVLGSGVGSAFYFGSAHFDDTFRLVHCEYLRVGFELGLVGLCIFVALNAWQIPQLWTRARRNRGVVSEAFSAAFLGMCVLVLHCCSGNPLAATIWFMNPLFGLIGAAYGTAAKKLEPDWGAQPFEWHFREAVRCRGN
jgi:O-Antigen ligase